ncbi:MAG: VTT domain-containing protein [Hyphomicrobiales bacterium]
MLARFYDRLLSAARRRHAVWLLAAVAFAESAFFPLPPDLLLAPMALGNRSRVWFYAALTTVSSVAGGLFGYLIGAALFDVIAQPIIDFYGYEPAFTNFSHLYNEYGAWVVFIAGVTPVPYKVVTIASGMTGLGFFGFIIASLVSRGIRFFAVAAIVYRFGPAVSHMIGKYINWAFWGLVGLAAVGLLIVTYV